ncbi:MAG TPA: zf-HC2 domain-containing protein [Actinomycetota bacterium]|nr:zf-HC2 domain-containing protein [Actinomycetota bacterium]
MNLQWHADPEVVARYADGRLDEARAYSLEAHLLACGECRALVPRAADLGWLEHVWAEIEEVVDAPRSGPVERLLIRLGIPDLVARLLAATPSLRLSWFGAVALVLCFAVLAAKGGHRGPVLFLAMAPLIPVAGVAASFGPGMDPTYEIGVAAPLRSFRLLLYRSAAVLVASVVFIGLAALALPGLDWTAAAWLLPAFALTVLTLAVSTVMEPVPSAVGVALWWVVSVALVGHLAGDGVAAFHADGQVVCVVLIAVAGLVLARRSEAFERGTWA